MDFLSISVFYVFERYFFRAYYFLYHWYVRGFRKALNWTINYLENLDYKFALALNFKNIFQPLYQDYSFMGHVLGFILRSLRIIVALVIYVLVTVFAAALFLAWAAFPVFVIYQIFANFPN